MGLCVCVSMSGEPCSVVAQDFVVCVVYVGCDAVSTVAQILETAIKFNIEQELAVRSGTKSFNVLKQDAGGPAHPNKPSKTGKIIKTFLKK